MSEKTETFSIRDIDNMNWLGHLLFESDRDKVHELVNQEEYNPKSVHLKLEVNGVVMRSEDFVKVLDEWGERIENQIKEKLGYYEKEEAVAERAEEIIRDKLSEVFEVLQDIEDNLWRLRG